MDDQDRIDFWIDAERVLKPDEYRILRLIADGYSCEEVAQMSTFSRRTCYRKHKDVYTKLQQMCYKTL